MIISARSVDSHTLVLTFNWSPGVCYADKNRDDDNAETTSYNLQIINSPDIDNFWDVFSIVDEKPCIKFQRANAGRNTQDINF